MNEFFRIQDVRKKYVLISNYYQLQFLKEASNRTGVSFDILKYSIFPEYGKILKGKLDLKNLKDRLSGCSRLRGNQHG
jgi:hypothetical protein